MKVDYLIGRKVTHVAMPVSDEDWTWSIAFEDDIRLRHTGNADIPPPAIDGTTLGTVDEQGAWTTMGFYSGSPATLIAEVKAQTKTLTIKLPDVAEALPITEPIDPTVDLPADPSDERVVEGPVKGN